ncbi:MXE protein, partial [Polypterus senegalus]
MNGVLYHQYEQKVRPYIDLIDFLRSLGIDQDLPLPSIAVIGDQSSGKSSVLEALSGVSLPRGSGIITRCPLEMKMKKIREGKPWKGTLKYRDIEMHLHDPKFVEEEILKAQNIIAGTASGISTELISLKIESSQVPDLTLIDLPGIARVAVGDQPSDIGEQIKSLIQTFIEKAETIILVVVPSIVDIATTEALKMAKEFDPDGQRTLGILTKPDMIDKGNEEKTVAVVRNLVIELKKGYMIVKCRGQQDINENLSLAEAIENERVFFKHHPYFSPFLDEKKATVQFLAVKLTNELVEHIIESLPNLKRKIEDKLDETATELKTYGQPVPVADKETISFLVESLIGDILEKEFRKAEKMLQSQFDMEKHIFSQDSIYSKILTKVNSMYAIHSDVNLMKAHLNTYLEITSDRLANQIPLIILHHIVNQYGTSLQTQIKDNTKNTLFSQYELKIRPYIDLIDSLRSLGVDQDLALPSIAVIGDQSSGKSSVLEALSGVSLPRGSAQNVITGSAVGISEELISLNVESPEVPNLTLIDLPGIARVAVGNQPKDIGEQIKRLIQKFIKKQETINLVVVPSNVDIATTEALKMAKEFDPTGQRTLGILTKPDLVDKGNEENIVDIVRNLVIEMKKGYMIVKCRSQQDIKEKRTLAEAIKKEHEFFDDHPYFRPLLDDKKATIPLLAEKLTNELVDHIIKLQEYYDVISNIIKGEETIENEESRVITTVRKMFADWKNLLDTKYFKLGNNLWYEIESSIERYRGKELPGFVNYATFEIFVKNRIDNLEEPSLDILRKVTDEIYSNVFDNVKKQQKFGSFGSSDVSVMKEHMSSYFKIASDRLANQIPLIIQYYIVHQYGSELQKKILQLIQGNKNLEELLEENKDVAEKRNRLRKRLERLNKAQEHLNKFSV